MTTEQFPPGNWYQIITCVSVTITATVALVVFFWSLLPEESRYWWRLKLGILRPDISLNIAVDKDNPRQPPILLENKGPRLQYDIILHVWDSPNYWTVEIWSERKDPRGKFERFELYDGKSRYRKFTLDPPDGVRQIGFLDPPAKPNEKREQGFLKWKVAMLDITVKEGVTWLPKPPKQHKPKPPN